MAEYVQTDRAISIQSPLGDDVLLLQSFTGQEEMSRLFSFHMDMFSETEGIAPADIVGKAVTLEVLNVEEEPRYFHGHINRFTYRGRNDRLHLYQAEMVPWLWFLTRMSDCRIFQNQKIPDIITTIFDDAGFSDYELQINAGDYTEWEYCVQYRETDFNFVSRLMEQAGIFYYFKHEQGRHILVLGDQKSHYCTIADSEVKFETGWVQQEWDDPINSWNHEYRFTTGRWSHTDFNFETPSTDLMANADAVVPIQESSNYEFYDYPGEFRKKNDADDEARIRIQEEDVHHEVVAGSGICRSFSPGGKFRMANHHSQSESNKGYVLTSVRHMADIGSDYLTGGEPRDFVYSNSFTAVPDSVLFRPARLTRKPAIQGIQTAIVTGPDGEEIWPDEFGRVKVQFHWDREGNRDENTTCWIRVAQPWTGANWGAIHIPRIGQEVVVSFLEADPDRPLVTGMVYNSETMPPYDLPDNKTQTGIKTRSTANGGADNFNELRFEDLKDQEEIYLHAERDFNRVVENNDTLKVGFEKSEPGDQEIEIYNDQSIQVGVGSGNGSQVTEIQNNQETTVHNGNRSALIEMGDDSLDISMGNQNTSIQLGSATTEAMQSITLRVGQSSVVIDQMGVTIEGMTISINGQMMTEISGMMTQVTANTALTLRGLTTMIN